MLCAVYRSPKKQQMYLFVEKRDDFSRVPDTLMSMFGTPILVTIVNLATKDKLAMADLDKVKSSLADDGFFLQLPPPVENLLDEHLAQMKAKKQAEQQGKDIES